MILENGLLTPISQLAKCMQQVSFQEFSSTEFAWNSPIFLPFATTSLP